MMRFSYRSYIYLDKYVYGRYAPSVSKQATVIGIQPVDIHGSGLYEG